MNLGTDLYYLLVHFDKGGTSAPEFTADSDEDAVLKALKKLKILQNKYGPVLISNLYNLVKSQDGYERIIIKTWI
jgi:hypothetical protein